MARLSAIDAQTYWMSAKIPNDQFLLYAFAGVTDPPASLVAGLRDRAAACPDLTLRIVDDCRLRYPAWVAGALGHDQFDVRERPRLDWTACLDAVAGLADRQLDPRLAAWRLHLFAPVTGAPGASAPVTVAVLQMVHALADGTRAAELAAWLFGRQVTVAPVASARRGSLLPRAVAAARTHRALVRDIAAGRTPAPPPPRPALSVNAAPSGPRRVRTLVRHRSALSDGTTTVTIAALTAIGTALADYLRDRGEDPTFLGAEVPMRKPGIRLAHNHFGNVGIGLYPDLPVASRAEKMVSDFRAARARAEHPAALAARRSFAAVPAPLLRWGVAQFDPTVRSPMVTGNTVVSSVNRGLADLRLGGGPVLLTAGYPALSPMMALTHGVHGIGETVAVSIHAASVVDLDDYVARLDHALPRGNTGGTVPSD